MRITQFFACFALATSAVQAASIPEINTLDPLEAHSASSPRSDILSPEHALEKRKGGGGVGGGGGGGGRGGGGSSSGGSSGGKSGGSSSGGGGGGASARTGPGSNVGGATRSGSGPARSFGGGGYYGGGASTPYKAGSRTPKGLLAGALLLPTAALLIFPGLWLYSVYPYNLNNYRFRNQTANATTQGVNGTGQNAMMIRDTTQGVDETLPVLCLCQDFSVCGCDNNDDQQYINDLVGNGSYAALNKTLVTVSDVNGTKTLVLNGTLPNGTTAPGGQDDTAAAAGLRINQYAGYWVMGMIVLSTVTLL